MATSISFCISFSLQRVGVGVHRLGCNERHVIGLRLPKYPLLNISANGPSGETKLLADFLDSVKLFCHWKRS